MSLLTESLERTEKLTQTIQTFYGLSRRAASILASFNLKTKEEAKGWVSNGGIFLKVRGCGQQTQKELYDWMGLEIPIEYNHTCPKCGHKYN